MPVIVRGDASSDVGALVNAAGGRVRADLGIIDAVAADMPADRVDELARADGVRWLSLDAGVSSTDDHGDGARDRSTDAQPRSVYPEEIGADHLWDDGDQGQGVGVAVVDTGIVNSRDFGDGRVVATLPRDAERGDGYGHGSHVAGLIAGDGTRSDGRYEGVAPGANLINVRVGDDAGAATISDVISGLQLVLENQRRFNIRVVNLSLRVDVPQSYTTDPLDAAVEFLTFRGILVVAAAGNTGSVADAVSYAPGNDPFVLTVGAVDDAGTEGLADDAVPSWSSRGTTQDGFAKPDVYAPGRHLVSVLSPRSVLAQEMPESIVGRYYMQLSGTSMAAAVASGAAALVIHEHPDWTPGQVKKALVEGAASLPADASAHVVQADTSAASRQSATPARLSRRTCSCFKRRASRTLRASSGARSSGAASSGVPSSGEASAGAPSSGEASGGALYQNDTPHVAERDPASKDAVVSDGPRRPGLLVAYVIATAIAGVALTAWGVTDATSHDALMLIALVIAACGAELFAVELFVDSHVSVSGAVLMAAGAIFGMWGVAATALPIIVAGHVRCRLAAVQGRVQLRRADDRRRGVRRGVSRARWQCQRDEPV